MFYVYVLEDADARRYIGYTRDLKRRLDEHNHGENAFTKRSKWRCIYYEACIEYDDARRRESYFKTTAGKNALRKRLAAHNKKVLRRDGKTSLHG